MKTVDAGNVLVLLSKATAQVNNFSFKRVQQH